MRSSDRWLRPRHIRAGAAGLFVAGLVACVWVPAASAQVEHGIGFSKG
jgi:hypothetical protein